VHNLTDGLIIGAAFVIDYKLGIATVLAVVLHEIPHEIGNFGVLIYAGFKKTKALLFNFLTGLTAVLGGILGFYLSKYVGVTANFLLPFAAGGFIYIAASDLIPEGRKERDLKKSITGFVIAVIGVLCVYFLAVIFPE
jgi:zinc and cadmium transporter